MKQFMLAGLMMLMLGAAIATDSLEYESPEYRVTPSEAAKEYAKNHPGEGVPHLQAGYDYGGEIPLRAILGYWDVNSDGEIIPGSYESMVSGEPIQDGEY
tara:strand:- start:695 stop:994 length:300 start_codon:yes stop_codon:yes gene_type:complete